MKNNNYAAIPRMIMLTAILPALAAILLPASSLGGSAAWELNPTSDDWNTAANWTPGGPPNGFYDTATFSVSNVTTDSVSEATQVSDIVFDAGASAFTISGQAGEILEISGAGVTNNSGVSQNFVASDGCQIVLDGPSTTVVGSVSVFTANGNNGGSSEGGSIRLYYGTSPGSASFIANGGVVSDSRGGDVIFESTGTAVDNTFTANGGSVRGALGGTTGFYLGSAGNATLIANGGAVSGAGGGYVLLSFGAAGGTARVELFGNGALDISGHDAPGVTIGSLEGSGDVYLGGNELVIGSNNLSTVFSGRIQDGQFGSGGSLVKSGKGKLTLTKASSYTGGTTVTAGTLLVNSTRGSGTGTGPVTVSKSTLGGTGIISGTVSIGGNSGRGAFIAPGNAGVGTLTTKKSLKLNATATYSCELDSNTATADKISAKGVTINAAAQIVLSDIGTTVLTSGTVFTMIDNTAATPINGTFVNLADGGTITVGSNTYLVSYEGGTGNDLTLTVQ